MYVGCKKIKFEKHRLINEFKNDVRLPEHQQNSY
jgi:hypothetical protein